ncbi:unnamed protein product [Dicrocoelium dendriticum]|nr:unnamed protein product [Dicrocoelium dendriticum]
MQRLVKEFGEEEQYLIAKHTKQLDDLKDIFVALDSAYAHKANDAKAEQHSLKDELRNRNLEDKHALRTALETKVNNLWAEFKTALNQYNRTTDEKVGFFETLKLKDEKSADEIEMQMRKLQRISEQISITRRRMCKVGKEFEEKNRHLKEEREKLMIHFQSLKTQLNKLRESQHEKLVKVSLESGAANKKVRILLNKAERIIKLAEHCRKYETEAEKVVPFYVSSLTEDEEAQVQKAFQVDGDDELAQILRQCVPLEMFWRRFNKVQLDRLAILKEHSVLEQENRQLKSLLKQYLDGISVNANVLEANNTLIVVNGRSNVNRRELTEDPRIRMLTCPTKSEFTADAPMQIPQQDTNTPFA